MNLTITDHKRLHRALVECHTPRGYENSSQKEVGTSFMLLHDGLDPMMSNAEWLDMVRVYPTLRAHRSISAKREWGDFCCVVWPEKDYEFNGVFYG